ncbi:hypothetical protein GCM10023346_20130 [Arthrobacter gyeryongensis]|uniref:Uncharacterized protein n=1 Tax=Arthrobacter gyeryongensis TaxID=1650592 RepID=A0ABP9SEX0_9MICC
MVSIVCRRKNFPASRALGPVLADYDGAAELDQGISILLAGLAAPLIREKTTPKQ